MDDPAGSWDPAGLTVGGATECFARRRQTESQSQHGRVSMLATASYIHLELTGKLPGDRPPSAGSKSADFHDWLGVISKAPAEGWVRIALYGAFCELSRYQSSGTAAAASDFGRKVLAFSDAAGTQSKLVWDIPIDRLAMVAIIGMFFQGGDEEEYVEDEGEDEDVVDEEVVEIVEAPLAATRPRGGGVPSPTPVARPGGGETENVEEIGEEEESERSKRPSTSRISSKRSSGISSRWRWRRPRR